MIFELLGIFGSVACLCGTLTDYRPMKIVWLYVLGFMLPGQTYLHVLTCLEHYLAVLHPITFRRLKEAKMIRIRHVLIGFIWLLCGSEVSFLNRNDWTSIILMLCSVWFNFSLCSFCSISVLCALNRPGPKRRVGDREQTGKSKLMAFYIIIVILGGAVAEIYGAHVGFIYVSLSAHGHGRKRHHSHIWVLVWITHQQQKQAQLRWNCQAENKCLSYWNLTNRICSTALSHTATVWRFLLGQGAKWYAILHAWWDFKEHVLSGSTTLYSKYVLTYKKQQITSFLIFETYSFFQ